MLYVLVSAHCPDKQLHMEQKYEVCPDLCASIFFVVLSDFI